MSRFLLDTGPAQKFVNQDPVVRRAFEERQQRGDVIGICYPTRALALRQICRRRVWSNLRSPEEDGASDAAN